MLAGLALQPQHNLLGSLSLRFNKNHRFESKISHAAEVQQYDFKAHGVNVNMKPHDFQQIIPTLKSLDSTDRNCVSYDIWSFYNEEN